MKRKPKVEAPKEAWAVVSPQNSAVINFARTMVPEGFAEVRYVPADPRRDAVVKAAVERVEAEQALMRDLFDANVRTRCDRAGSALIAAVEKMQRSGK